MTQSAALSVISKMLSDEEMDCVLEEASENTPHPRVLLYLGADFKNRNRILEITAQEQLLAPNSASQDDKEGFVRVQFYVQLPFTLKDHTLHDISSTLLFVNRMMDLPGLELSEFDNRVSYRYVLMAAENGITKPLILSIVGLVMLYIDTFSENIEKIGDGTTTFNNLLEEIIEVSKKVPL